MDQLDRKELQYSVESLLSVLKCPVCHGLLEKNSVLCYKGHAMCKKCLGKENTCPYCKNCIVNLQQNTLLSQILETIPHVCRYDKCTHLVKTGEDHEMYCRFRPTECRYSGCTWVGSVDNLLFHVEDKHPEKVFSGTKNFVKVSKGFFDSKDYCFGGSSVLLFSSCGHYFWQLGCSMGMFPPCPPAPSSQGFGFGQQNSFGFGQQKNVLFSLQTESQTKERDTIKLRYLPLWVDKPTRDIYLRVCFKTEEKECDAGVKIKKNQIKDANNADHVIFPYSIITDFCNENELKYHVLITEERDQAIKMLLE